MSRILYFASVLAALLFAHISAAAPPAAKNHRIGEISVAAGRFVGLPKLEAPFRVDLDGDGIDEIVGTAAGAAWLVDFDAATRRFNRPQRIVSSECLAGAVPVLSTARRVSEFAVLDYCQGPSIYAGKPAQLKRRYPDSGVSHALAVADFDADGELEFLQVNSITEADGTATALDSRVFINQGNFVVGQFDADPALEIAVSTYSSGFILDGATGLAQAEYAGGFGSSLQIAELDGDAGPEFVGFAGDQVVGFDPSPLRTLFQIPVSPFIPSNGLTVANQSPNVDEIWLQGFDKVSVFRQVSGAYRYTTDFSLHAEPVQAVIAGRFSAGLSTPVAFWTQAPALDSNVYGLTRPFSSLLGAEPAFQTPEFQGIADFGNADRRLVGLGNGYGPTFVQEYALGTSNLVREWSIESTAVGGEYIYRVIDFAVAQLDADPAPEYVLLLSTSVGYSLRVLDGATLAVQWQRAIESQYSVEDRSIALGDAVGGAALDVCFSFAFASAVHARCLNGATGVPLWTSQAFSSDSRFNTGLVSADVDADQRADFIIHNGDGFWVLNDSGAFSFSGVSAAYLIGYDPFRGEVLSGPGYQFSAFDVATRLTVRTVTLNNFSFSSFHTADNGVALVRGYEDLRLIDTIDGASIDVAPIGRTYYGLEASVLLTGVPGTINQRAYVPTNTGWLEFVLGPDPHRIFGGADGGFED